MRGEETHHVLFLYNYSRAIYAKILLHLPIKKKKGGEVEELKIPETQNKCKSFPIF